MYWWRRSQVTWQINYIWNKFQILCFFKSLRPGDTCIGKLCKHGFRWWLVIWTIPNHYPKQCWFYISWVHGNTWHMNTWHFNQNMWVFSKENAFEYVIEKPALLCQSQRVKNNITGLQTLWHLYKIKSYYIPRTVDMNCIVNFLTELVVNF